MQWLKPGLRVGVQQLDGMNRFFSQNTFLGATRPTATVGALKNTDRRFPAFPDEVPQYSGLNRTPDGVALNLGPADMKCGFLNGALNTSRY
ncbi:MAG: hypothetical protein HY098_07880 [Nitrospinae bacterium]|nr:hypothetical protein [Nitrospinota bacterium]